MLYLILGGQILSMFITGTGVFSQLLANRQANIPTSQSMLNYALLSLFHILLIVRYRRAQHQYQLFQHDKHLHGYDYDAEEEEAESSPTKKTSTHTHTHLEQQFSATASTTTSSTSPAVNYQSTSAADVAVTFSGSALTSSTSASSSSSNHSSETSSHYSSSTTTSSPSDSYLSSTASTALISSSTPTTLLSDDPRRASGQRSSSSNALTSSRSNYMSAPTYLQVSVWKYLLLGFCDVEGNFLFVKAYEYTTITSVQLLDCFTVPNVMLLSYLCLKFKYNKKHLLGAFICMVGLSLLITSDILSGKNDMNGDGPSTSNQIIGDVLVLIGCLFYAISNTAQEYLVKKFDMIEFLAMLGSSGFLVSVIQVSILERDALAAIDWNDPVIWSYLLGFNFCLCSLYLGIPVLLQHSSAIFMNLSFLTSDFWSIFTAIMLFHAHLHALYFVAFSVILVGLIIYNLASVNVTLSEIWHYLYQLVTRVPYQPPAEQGWIGLTDEVDDEEQIPRSSNKHTVQSSVPSHIQSEQQQQQQQTV